MIFFTRVTIGSLPDNVLLDIFDCYRTSPDIPYQGWHVLVHVCRSWRFIAFASPLRLDLRLECNANTPVEKTLDVWPRAFPIVIKESRSRLPLSGANIIAAIKHHDRVSEIDLYATTTLLKRLYRVMKKPYPVLTHLHLEFDKKLAPVAPDTFLGRSTPRLKYLNLIRIPFPTLPNLLPICHDLITVHLEEVPNSGYISPEAMATALSGLTKLESFHIGFESPASFPDPRNRPPSSLTRVVKRVVLPSLSHLEFRGASEYFEDLVAQIDAPATIIVYTRFFNQLDFDISQFLQFIGRTQIPRSFEEAKLYFVDRYAYINVGPRDPTGVKESSTGLSMTILCHALDWQVAGVAQICSRISPFLSNVERLLISNGYGDYTNETFSTDYVDIPQWLELFHAFSALQHMRIPPRMGEIIGSVLQELTEERTMDALPMLHHLYLPSSSISVRQAIEPFISSRQHFNHPVAVHLTEMD
jgi:F-box-like